MLRNFKNIASLAFVLVLLAVPAGAGERDATSVVRGFQAGLLGVMKQAETLGVRGRFERLLPLIEQSFHLPLMIATASSPFWRSGTPEQKARLLAAFRRMSASTLATLFDGHDGETFRVIRERRTDGPAVLVDTEIVRPADDPVEITYVGAELLGRWWMIDVIVAGGISEVKVRRNEYLKQLREGGLDRLTEVLENKADRLLSGAATAQVRN